MICAPSYAVLSEAQGNDCPREVLGADDLVPIFIFVLCQSGLVTPLRDKDLLWALCHPDQLYGEAGYYLTVYESACAFVEAQVE